MGGLSTGGGSSAVAASAHAGCERFRCTDPLVVGMSRRALATALHHPDTTAGIPEARWVRAMTFERLVRHERFVSELLTTAVGKLDLARPAAVRRADGKVQVAKTRSALGAAHLKAVHEDTATMITSLAVPFPGMEDVPAATPVKPDFAIVAPRYAPAPHKASRSGAGRVVGSWLIIGDAKDYERVRSRIDDGRMLKGFLQVALGAEAVERWSKLPSGMVVHRWGALAVPRNAFLQPAAIVEDLDDHRTEVMDRVRERQGLLQTLEPLTADGLPDFVAHLEAAFDPAGCTTCALFNHCRSELRSSSYPASVLVEIGVRPEDRPGLLPVLEGKDPGPGVAASLAANVRATTAGLPVFTGQRRVDPVGLPGTIQLALVKADGAALGVHGVTMKTIVDDELGIGAPWAQEVFDDAQAQATRLGVMERLGGALDEALGAVGLGDPWAEQQPEKAIHIVVPDSVTADVLVTIADSLAGVEISRLRWARDLEMGRPVLTFNGEPAVIPPALTPRQRLAVSFLLEADRSRALTLRTPIIDLRSVLAAHVVPGGARTDVGRLDYLVRWALATTPVNHRDVSDEISEQPQTPGARLSNARSDAIHRASRRARGESHRASRHDRPEDTYEDLVREELTYKAEVMDAAVGVLADQPVSAIQQVRRSLEAGAQRVWRRRERLQASDLTRFGRVNWVWRNDQVAQIEADTKLSTQLAVLANPQVAADRAAKSGVREVASATVVALNPIRLAVHSRRLGDGSPVHLAHSNLGATVDLPWSTLKTFAGSFKFGMQPVGPLTADDQTEVDGSLLWQPRQAPILTVGEDIILLDGTWVTTDFANGRDMAVHRPNLDTSSSPKADCRPGDFADDPKEHQWCCRPHAAAEAETSDWIAERREAGQMNPQVWPPLVDGDAFDTVAVGAPTETDSHGVADTPPDSLTSDDLD